MLLKKRRLLPEISIGVTTFEHRFDKYFVPLLSTIREYDAETEVIVAINGEHNQKFGEGYRKRILEFLSAKINVFAVMFPRFRGPTKLWNTIIVHATYDYILMLNDDIMVTNRKFVEKIKKTISKNDGRSFLINKSWSHFVISREEIDQLGYFDERLLGIGEEDGDMTWRYLNKFNRPMANYSIRGIENYSEDTVHTYKPTNIKCHSNTKYSLFNREFMFTNKYRPDDNGVKGMFDMPVSMNDPGPDQYPNERFYREHKDDL